MAHLFLFILLFSSVCRAQNQYTLADLEVLVQEEGHQEFFQHALDVRPSERQDAWKTMVSKMADVWSRKILQKSEISRKEFQKIEELYAWPSLKTDDIYKVRRQEAGLRYLKTCLKSEKPCWDDLKNFWEKDKTDPDSAFKLAELTSVSPDSPLSTWTLLEVSLKSPLSEFYCKKEFVMSALWGKIEIDYIKLGPEGDLLTKIDQTVHPDCLPQLIGEARTRLYRPKKVQDREIAFQIIKSQMKADQEITDFFYTAYLLDNPAQGELFNYSWNRVKELGGTVERREIVLKKLRSLDPLPDAIMGSLDQTKKKVVLKHLKTYFPEYLDFYADQCIKFFGGKGSFPEGNPTVHCQELMSSEVAHDVLDDWKIKNYNNVRQI
jgi:hypothetical protein